MTLPAQAQIIVIGGGIIGCSTAYHLARDHKADVLLLEQGPALFELEHEIERATVIQAHAVARDVITMNSRALLRLDDEAVEVALVYPEDENPCSGRFSVCSDVGAAILGYREGDAVYSRSLQRTHHIAIEKVLYQPEAAGDFDL